MVILGDLDVYLFYSSGFWVYLFLIFFLGFMLGLENIRGSLSSIFSDQESLVSEKLFIFIFLTNLSGLSGSWEPISVWPLLVLSLSFMCWLGVISRWMSSGYESMISHFTPSGLSLMGSVPMAMIEFLSSVIRPLTLGMRLCANIMGGHLIFDLLGVFNSGVISYLCMSFYEVFVCMMQGIIFSLLVLSYSAESEESL